MTFTHFMGGNPPAFHNGVQNYDTQSAPWVSSHFPIDMPSTFPSSPWPTYTNTSIGSGGTMTPLPTSLFDMSHVPQPTFIVGAWNLPSYGSSPIYAPPGANTQVGAYSTHYTQSVYLSSTMSVPLNTFPMTGPHASLGISYEENQFYGLGHPLHGTPSQGGNLYPHLNSPYQTSISS